MLATRLHTWLIGKPNRSSIGFWLGASLLVSLLYSLPALRDAFSSAYVIQDDARQHVFWLRRFLDPELFPNDLMADYFQSVAPWGYTTLYRLFAILGVDPVLLSKLLPPVLGLITTVYCFGVGIQILPLPMVGFTTATLLNQNLWMRDDLVSATPGAFFYPIFLAFLYYLLRGSLLPCCIAIALQGLFYPQGIFLSAGVLLLRLVDWSNKRPRLTQDRAIIRLSLAGLAVAAGVIGLYALKSSQFGEVITLAEARALPAFTAPGWSAFFSDDPIEFWFCGKRSGLMPTEWCDLAKSQDHFNWGLLLLRFPPLGLGLLLPLLIVWRNSWPLAQQISAAVWILPQTLLVSLLMFLIAHPMAFKLHLPNRYSEHSLRILLALAAGVALVVLWDGAMRWLLQRGDSSRVWLALGLTAMVSSSLIFYPFSLEIDNARFPVTGYIEGEHPGLYQFLAQQPKDIVIASLTEEANQLPSFAQRSLLAGGEGYLLPYHPHYFAALSQRLIDLLQAQYSPNLQRVKDVIQRYGIDFWLLDRDSFSADFSDSKAYRSSLFAQFPEVAPSIQAQLQAGTLPALEDAAKGCAAYREPGVRLLRAECLMRK
ncbi:MAG: hypothetical protein IGS50_23995 [Synechococcales cyanobacterium C42_A2020_086]|jgi:hypothetical protein|nr:hypothetical protein [Synechococcales cyanobacterium C42_A2020_086]